jgi:drug/metabolite transporter (DMT)-like permease
MKFKDSFHPYAITTIIFWSCAYVLSRLALSYFTVYALGFLRYIIASVVLLMFVLVTKMKLPARRDLKWFLAAGASGIALYMVAFNTGQAALNSSTASVVIALAPVVTPVLARFVYHERLKRIQWLAIGVSFSGVIVLTVMSGGLKLNMGIVWLLAAVLLLSVFNILQRKLTKAYTALQTSAFSIFAGTLLLSVFLPSSVGQVVKAPGIQLVYIAILGVGSSAIAYCAWAAAFQKAEKTSSVSNYMFVTPFLASVLGVVIGGETIAPSTVLGGLIILAGLLLFNLSGRRADKKTAAEDKCGIAGGRVK